jgi:hypothetical protein
MHDMLNIYLNFCNNLKKKQHILDKIRKIKAIIKYSNYFDQVFKGGQFNETLD